MSDEPEDPPEFRDSADEMHDLQKKFFLHMNKEFEEKERRRLQQPQQPIYGSGAFVVGSEPVAEPAVQHLLFKIKVIDNGFLCTLYQGSGEHFQAAQPVGEWFSDSWEDIQKEFEKAFKPIVEEALKRF